MNISKLTAPAFCLSIEKALINPPDVETSVNRIRKIINGLPDAKLYISNQGSRVTFFSVVNGEQKYISKKSPLIYALARRRYLSMLLEILELTGSRRKRDILRRETLVAKLQKFVCICETGNLDIARIILTKGQYQWFTKNFRQKHLDKATAYSTTGGLCVRSKSERDIINHCEAFAVPFHYEEQQIIYVKELVDRLQDDLTRSGKMSRELYTFRNSRVFWNVPPELEWMNATGSIWKTYYPPNGTITIFIDIKIMFADGHLLLWEHEGMMNNFFYRCNASERASILTFTKTVRKELLLETYEHDIDTPEKLINIIERTILPRLWF